MPIVQLKWKLCAHCTAEVEVHMHDEGHGSRLAQAVDFSFVLITLNSRGCQLNCCASSIELMHDILA